ncbi:Sesquiterpene synthase [Rhynchospora pubera]|uniref:Sesquiterpene synthase n=1 Tax=Rhynchospora pubera TaxID=906938 RepID=A0AAV8GBE6_9POAL|nr:Sesquiterpene synthase [Rhynchospora pubera]KAJ4801536.1 Sesquiterpene synthase [Rhynchospora pubera]
MENTSESGKLERRSYVYEPNLWGDFFITHAVPIQSQDWLEMRVNELKAEVRTLIKSSADIIEKITLIDTIQHLGIGYLFEKEIDEELTSLNSVTFDSNDLHEVALYFRLLRQHGFPVSADIFSKFKNDDGSFKTTLSRDARGLLSLYNAASLRICDEDILEKASFLAHDGLICMIDDLKCPLKNQVSRALKTPLPRMSKRLEARWYIHEYEEESPNHVILELAKLDFNIVQALHCEELKAITIWWKDFNLKQKLGYARDRIVETYFWMTGVYFEPQFSRARIILVKAFALITILDDTYDVHATLEECRQLAHAVQRWDKESAEMLDDYLKVVYLKLISLCEETEKELEPSEKYRASYLIEWYKTQIRSYLQEAEWLAAGYIPTFKERLDVSLITSGVPLLCCASFIGMGDIATKEAFLWVNQIPDMVRASFEIARFIDDVVGHEREHLAGELATVLDCYIKEQKISKEEAVIRFKCWTEGAWRRLNKARLMPTAVSPVLIERIFNFSAMIQVLYNHMSNGFCEPINVKEYITLLYIEPLSV